MTRTQSLLLSSMLTIAVVSCQSSEPEPPAPATESTAPESTAPESTAAGAPTPSPSPGGGEMERSSEEVAYEPAYPADVSSEGLSEEDVAQQEAGLSRPGHSHGGDEHSHGDGDHTHGEDEDSANDGHEH